MVRGGELGMIWRGGRGGIRGKERRIKRRVQEDDEELLVIRQHPHVDPLPVLKTGTWVRLARLETNQRDGEGG